MKILKKHKTFINKLFYAVAVLPIIFIGLLILHYGVNVPTFDQWELISYIQKFDSHTLTLANLFAQHNEHRIFFPRVIMIEMGQFTHWNVVVEMLFSLGLQILSFALIWKAINRTLEGLSAKLCVLLASIFMFNPMQWENWLWGWQIQWYLAILGMLIGLYFCWYMPLRRAKLNHAMAIVGATIATFSLAGGLVTWILLLALLTLRKQITALAVYIGFFLSEVAIYLHNYHSVTGHTPLSSLFTNQLDFFRYITLYIGGSLSNDDQLAPILGAISIGIVLVLSCKAVLARQKKSYFWIALAFFVLVSAAITGSGRFLLGPDQALASRYTSFSLLWLISLVVLATPYVRQVFTRSTPWLQPIAIVGLAVLCVLFSITSLSGITNARFKNIRDKNASACLNKEAVPDSACFSLVYPSTPESDKRNLTYLKFLREEHLAGRQHVN